MQGNRNSSNIKRRGTERGKEQGMHVRNGKGKRDPTPGTPFRYDGEYKREIERKNQFDNTDQERQTVKYSDK